MPVYRTVIGPADKIDQDVNHLAKEGWIVQQAFVVGSIDIDPIDEDGFAEMEMPIIAYLMWKESEPVPADIGENGRPVRKVLGGKNL